MIEEKLDRIDARLDGVHARLDGIDTRLDGIDTRLGGIDGRFVDLERHMRVLHEDAKGDIRAVAESVILLEERMDRRFDAMAADSDRHRAFLEDVLRSHARTFGDHEGRITALERERRH